MDGFRFVEEFPGTGVRRGKKGVFHRTEARRIFFTNRAAKGASPACVIDHQGKGPILHRVQRAVRL